MRTQQTVAADVRTSLSAHQRKLIWLAVFLTVINVGTVCHRLVYVYGKDVSVTATPTTVPAQQDESAIQTKTDDEWIAEITRAYRMRASNYEVRCRQLSAIRKAAKRNPGTQEQRAYLAWADLNSTDFPVTPIERLLVDSDNPEIERALADVRQADEAFQMLLQKIDELLKATKHPPGSPESEHHISNADEFDHSPFATIARGLFEEDADWALLDLIPIEDLAN